MYKRQRLGIPCGAYWFSYALNTEMARNEARFCANALGPYQVDYPVSYDLEYESMAYATQNGVTITRQLATLMVKAFCDEIAARGYRPMYYANKDYIENVFFPSELRDYYLWYARYRTTLDRSDVAIWQYTETGSISGVNGNVDLNLSFLDGSAPPTTGDDWVRRLQEEINRQGYGPVTVDGLPGPQTLDALPTVRRGAQGNITRLLQERLGATPDGVFGAATEDRVRNLQRRAGLTQDGVVGPSTWARLLYR